MSPQFLNGNFVIRKDNSRWLNHRHLLRTNQATCGADNKTATDSIQEIIFRFNFDFLSVFSRCLFFLSIHLLVHFDSIVWVILRVPTFSACRMFDLDCPDSLFVWRFDFQCPWSDWDSARMIANRNSSSRLCDLCFNDGGSLDSFSFTIILKQKRLSSKPINSFITKPKSR